jgi:hypothetical protein
MVAAALVRRAAVVAAATGLLAGCASAPTSPARQTPIPLASSWQAGLLVAGHGPVGLGPSASATDSTLADPVQQQLATVGLLAGDVSDGARVALAADGTSLGQKSLNYCQAPFPSEAAREARRKVELLDAAGARTGVSTEAVLYRTSADAAAALEELTSADATCPSPRTITFSGHDLVLTRIGSEDVPTVGLTAVPDRVLISTLVHDTTAAVTYQVRGVYQVRGRVLAITVLSSGGADITTLELETLHSLSRSVAERLTRLDPGFAQPS